MRKIIEEIYKEVYIGNNIANIPDEDIPVFDGVSDEELLARFIRQMRNIKEKRAERLIEDIKGGFYV